jgi:CheY-like chemotaxis protein
MNSRVLVVDDDPALSEMLSIVLRGEGFDTAVVSEGTRALPALRELRPDVVLLDLMLPGMNGIDVCRAIRAESGMPIVMLTAKSDTVDVVLGLESGADDYMIKPFKPKELAARQGRASTVVVFVVGADIADAFVEPYPASAASAIVTSCRTSWSQISYFCDGESIRFARRPARSVPRSSSVMIRSSENSRRTRRMLSDRHTDLYREVRRKTKRFGAVDCVSPDCS